MALPLHSNLLMRIPEILMCYLTLTLCYDMHKYRVHVTLKVVILLCSTVLQENPKMQTPSNVPNMSQASTSSTYPKSQNKNTPYPLSPHLSITHAHIKSLFYNTVLLLAVFIYGFNTYSFSASFISNVPNLI